MKEVVFRGWCLAYDSEATERAYALARPVGPELCGCRDCRNFVAAREVAYPADLKDLAALVGVSPLTETEICELGPATGDCTTPRIYAGFFHFVGSILDDPSQESEQVYFLSQRNLLPESFGSAPVVEVKFVLEVPWLLSEPPGA